MQHCYKLQICTSSTVHIYNITQRPCTMHSGLLPARDQVVYDLSMYVVSSIHIYATTCSYALFFLIYLPQFVIYLVCVYHVHL